MKGALNAGLLPIWYIGAIDLPCTEDTNILMVKSWNEIERYMEEQSESIIDAVIREMKEETGLDIQNPRLCGIKQFPIENGRYIVFLFHTDEFFGEVTSSEEGEMVWVKRSELSKMNTVKWEFGNSR